MAYLATHQHFLHAHQIPKERKDVRILVVDDDDLTRHLLGLALKGWGCECVEAENGRIALEKLGIKPVDLVISDQQMPIMTGTEFITELHSRYKEYSPPVILVSGDNHPELQNNARELGVEAFFGKPYQMKTLLQALESILDNRRIHAFVN